MTPVTLRPEQEAIVHDYAGGKVGIAAVPGSGKTFTLAHLSARLITDQRIGPEQEVLVVTFTNSAVNGFQARIARLLRDRYGLLPFVGYRVRTLHGLAHDIVRERPALVGLADDFTILDEKLSLEIQRDIVTQRVSEWRDHLDPYLDPENDSRNARRQFDEDLPGLVTAFIKRAKDLRRAPDDLLAALSGADARFDLARFAAHVYADYQRSLAYRGAVDFDDLVRLALEALDLDPQYLDRLRDRWPYILEDEAQDSSRLQEDMLSLLSAGRNWVRVGDPNQAINTTFTTADPRFLLDFLEDPAVTERPLSVSGRSVPSIIMLANELARWTVDEHPYPDLRDAFDYHQDARRGRHRGYIQPTAADDPQPNPPDDESWLELLYRFDQRIKPDDEIDLVVSADDYSLTEWLAALDDLPDGVTRPTAAILVPRNNRGFNVVEALRRLGVKYEELLRSTTETRTAVDLLHKLLVFLAEPTDLKKLKTLYWALMPESQRELVQDDADLRQTITAVFARWRNLEDFLWPDVPGDAIDVGELRDEYAWLGSDLAAFRVRVRRWLQALTLPIDQLVLTVAQDIFSEPVDVALAHKVAVLLHSLAASHPEWRLPEFIAELRAISSNERRFIGFDDAEAGYEPTPGVVTVATMHAAKGLEWDRVYLMSVSNYDFPSGMANDSFFGEKWYARGSYDGSVLRLNLEAESLRQLDVLLARDPDSYDEGEATLQARLDYARERLRLLYVGITRAKRELIISWNMGRFWHKGEAYINQPALPLVALGEFARREYLGKGS